MIRRGLGLDARVDMIVESLLEDVGYVPRKTDSVSNWPRAQTAIRRGGLSVIETATPTFTAMLRLDPDRHDAGDYEIRPRPHGGTERGRTTKVITVAADENDYWLSMLTPFPTRYAVATVGATRPHARMIWLVGLRDFRIVETGGADDDVA